VLALRGLIRFADRIEKELQNSCDPIFCDGEILIQQAENKQHCFSMKL
jgi:hypothetical protein